MKAFPISQDLDVIQSEVDLNTAKVTDLVHPLVETAVPSGAVFTDTDTVYDDTVLQSEVDLNTADRHSHLNKTVLDKFGENVGGLPTFNGNTVDTTIAQRDVYDGLDGTDNTISLASNNGKLLKDVQDTQQISIDLNTAKVTDLVHPLVETAVPVGAVFTDTDTVYDDTVLQSEVDLNTLSIGKSGTSIIDFGLSNKVSEVVVTGVTQTLSTSIVMSSMRLEQTAEHSVDDLQIDPIRVFIKDLVAGVGFTVCGTMENAPANGTYKIDWNLTN
tara:strand:- start:13071 stop:13889 length:819 start_codon:yes stop_codon:yes gene_type:complete